MWFYVFFTWLSYAVLFSFFTLALAAGLYYLAELVEEYSMAAFRIIRYLILITIALYVGLWLFENFPILVVGFGIAAHIVHLILLRTFPNFVPTSGSFVLTLLLFAVNHYLAFRHFATERLPFSECLAYMTLCLWLVPFAFLISLSANDQTLPLVGHTSHESTQYGMTSFLTSNDNDVVSRYFSTQQKRGGIGLLALFKRAKDAVLPGSLQSTKRFT